MFFFMSHVIHEEDEEDFSDEDISPKTASVVTFSPATVPLKSILKPSNSQKNLMMPTSPIPPSMPATPMPPRLAPPLTPALPSKPVKLPPPINVLSPTPPSYSSSITAVTLPPKTLFRQYNEDKKNNEASPPMGLSDIDIASPKFITSIIELQSKEEIAKHEREVLQATELQLKGLRKYLYFATFSVILSLILAFWSLINISSAQPLSVTLLCVVTATIVSCSTMVLSFFIFKPILNKVTETKDVYQLTKIAHKFLLLMGICDLNAGLQSVIIFWNLLVIIFRLKVAPTNPDGIFDLFEFLSREGKAIYTFLFLNFFYSCLSFGVAKYKAYEFNIYYIQKAVLANKEK